MQQMYSYNKLTKVSLLTVEESRAFVPKRFKVTTMCALAVVFIFLVIVTSQTRSQSPRNQECQQKTYGPNRIVCVCNSTYCDRILTPEKIGAPQYAIYTSNRAGSRFERHTGTFQVLENNAAPPSQNNNAAPVANRIIVNGSFEYQNILGWGGAFTDSTGINIKSLSDGAQRNLLRSYFSDEGIEYSLCRVPIGGTDFSTHGYSYDDGPEDRTLENFKLSPEDFNLKIPLIEAALNLTQNNLKLFASAWTAPKWMKTNGDYAGFGFLKDEMYQAWADYFLKFFDSYKKLGIEFWGVTTGNEPSLGLLPFGKINSVAWLPSQMAKWISNNLGPTLRKSSHSDIKIMALDDQRFFLPWYIDTIFASETAKQYVDGIAVHWYYDKVAPASLLHKTHESYPDKFILATEACNGDKPFQEKVILGSWDRGESYADDIIQDLLSWVGGWIDWNMALDETGGPTYIGNNVDAPIIVNAKADEFYKQPTFYALGHFAKFIPRDSVRIYSRGFDAEIPVVALKRPDGARVLVILNKKNSKISATVVDDLRGNTRVELSPKSINTILYW